MMDCPTCGADDMHGNFCADCGARLVEPEPEITAEAVETMAEAELANADANASYAAAELERAQHATPDDVELVEAEVDAVEAEANAEVALAAIDAAAEVAVAAIEHAGDEHAEPDGDEGEPPDSELAELAADELDLHAREHEALPPQPDDEGGDAGEHVEPITLLRANAASTTTTRRTTSWRRHRR